MFSLQALLMLDSNLITTPIESNKQFAAFDKNVREAYKGDLLLPGEEPFKVITPESPCFHQGVMHLYRS